MVLKNQPCSRCGQTRYLCSDRMCIPCHEGIDGISNIHTQRVQAIELLGGRCACCGERKYHFLDIDHVENDGGPHRLELRNKKYSISRWVIDFPEEAMQRVQLLCGNCHASKTRYGRCPHNTWGKFPFRNLKLVELLKNQQKGV